MTPLLLDLFCGAGGAAMGYHQAGFDVVGVDIRPQPNYPFSFIRGDALEPPVDLEQFDAIHASPPCQAFTAYARRPNHVGDYPDLIAEVRGMLRDSHVPFVIENIPGSTVENLVTLCGSSFGLDVRRHRWFETSFPMLVPSCSHGLQRPRFPQATNRTNKRSTVEVGVWRIPLDVQQRAMEIDWMNLEELSEAVPPAYAHFIGERLMYAHAA